MDRHIPNLHVVKPLESTEILWDTVDVKTVLVVDGIYAIEH
jgi:hypothetical protein